MRILNGVLLILATFFGWWFVSLPLAAIGAWYLRGYPECILAGIAYDALFGMGQGMGVWGYAGTIAAAVIAVVVVGLKRVVR